MELLIKFRRKKDEIEPFIGDLLDIILGKCYCLLMVNFYVNLCRNKTFIYIQS